MVQIRDFFNKTPTPHPRTQHTHTHTHTHKHTPYTHHLPHLPPPRTTPPCTTPNTQHTQENKITFDLGESLGCILAILKANEDKQIQEEGCRLLCRCLTKAPQSLRPAMADAILGGIKAFPQIVETFIETFKEISSSDPATTKMLVEAGGIEGVIQGMKSFQQASTIGAKLLYSLATGICAPLRPTHQHSTPTRYNDDRQGEGYTSRRCGCNKKGNQAFPFQQRFAFQGLRRTLLSGDRQKFPTSIRHTEGPRRDTHGGADGEGGEVQVWGLWLQDARERVVLPVHVVPLIHCRVAVRHCHPSCRHHHNYHHCCRHHSNSC
eukprot:TRINITY_DN2967_c0_g1_i2.p1 TRINITY_DN2967_c0_g1~~TRINITY_DN2967_c0_g1_i2.p1  ORF type:complete len:321 (+),score=46.01 TRINITY_DN2967_c0_g1_i2:524-1486(+)